MKSRKIITIEYILRIAVFMTFFGHGYLALMANQRWAVYLQTVGFSFEDGLKIMPFIGGLDILVAIVIIRVILGWTTVLEISGRWPWQGR